MLLFCNCSPPWDVSVPRSTFRIVDWTSYHETRSYRIYILSEDNLQVCSLQMIVLGCFVPRINHLLPECWMLIQFGDKIFYSKTVGL